MKRLTTARFLPRNLPLYLSKTGCGCIVTAAMNSETVSTTEKTNNLRNPKLIRSFASDPELEDRLKKESESSGRSMSSVIRLALRKFFGL